VLVVIAVGLFDGAGDVGEESRMHAGPFPAAMKRPTAAAGAATVSIVTTPSKAKGGEEGGGGIEAIAQHEGVAGEGGYYGFHPVISLAAASTEKVSCRHRPRPRS
jgi:hypothetical protein